MPGILLREPEDLWLNEDVQDTVVLTDILHPFPAGAIAANGVPLLVARC